MDAKTKAAIRGKLALVGDSVRIGKDEVITVRSGFFYRFGKTSEDLRAEVLRAIPEAQVTVCEEHWNSWPKNSWWEVRFTLPGAK